MSSSPARSSRAVIDRDGRRYAFADHNCFACGNGNPVGLHLEVEVDDGTARASWTPDENFAGWEGKLHGGLLATLLDEVMAWACAADDAWAVTAEMHIRYRTPANPGERLEATGRVLERRRRIYQVHGEVRGVAGRLIAEADGRFLGASPTQKADLKQRYAEAPAPLTGARA